jgi:enoyl-CoA hydratase/carnithine racemase
MPSIALPQSFDVAVSDDGIAIFTLNRPREKNALTVQTYEELRDTFRGAADDERIKVVVLTGAGNNFCSGGHVKEIIGQLVDATETQLRQFNELTMQSVVAMRQLPKPIIASIDGVAAGGGAALALAADLRVASNRAKIGFVFPKVGLCAGDMGVSWMLPRVVGAGRAAELLLFGELIAATEAQAMGLVNLVVSPNDLQTKARAWALRLIAGPRVATARTKALLNATWDQNFAQAMIAEGEAQTACMQEPDFREGYEAFVEKRLAAFGKNARD